MTGQILTYDAAGNRTCAGTGSSCASASDRITATYDRLGRVLTVDDNGDRTADTRYTYSLTSPQWTDPTGTYLVTLDAFDRPTALDEPVSTTATFTWAYRADGQVASRADPNGNTTATGYDALGRPETKTTTGTGGVARAAYAWTRNAAGSVLAESSTITSDPTNNTRLFAYDPRRTPDRVHRRRRHHRLRLGRDAQPHQRPTVGGPVGPHDLRRRQPAAHAEWGRQRLRKRRRRPAHRAPRARRVAASQRLEWDSLGRLARVRPPNGNSTIALYTYDPLDRLHLVDHGGADRVRVRYAGLTTAAVQTIDDQSGAVIANTGTGWTGEPLEDWTGIGQQPAGLRAPTATTTSPGPHRVPGPSPAPSATTPGAPSPASRARCPTSGSSQAGPTRPPDSPGWSPAGMPRISAASSARTRSGRATRSRQPPPLCLWGGRAGGGLGPGRTLLVQGPRLGELGLCRTLVRSHAVSG